MLYEKLGIGGIMVGSKAKLARSANIEKTLFSNDKMTDVVKELPTLTEAKAHLAQFGKYAEGINLVPDHAYKYVNAHGAAQLYDTTAGQNVIQAVIHLKKPLTTLINANILKK